MMMERFLEQYPAIQATSMCSRLRKSMERDRNPTLSQILPILGKLKDHFEVTDEDSMFISTIKEKIWGDISKRYQDENIRLFLEEATAIDPRFKTKIPQKRPKLSALEELFAEEDRHLNAHRGRSNGKVQKDVDLYRSLPATLTSVDPVTWWWEKRDSLPALSELSHKYLCVQASSTPSERILSTAGDTISQE
ncbi:hypothetical protein SKAU_G00413510 [Synaphobranchus kaupii]|uniref:HAT C-terminal dimerisation domain-containing protein n=1 Tax=Synaphobranchus kaupii TaxID=118154 RepID=A0A9Q1E883_SYNKA|nr:hypothetical protein SKAU_G00413510 [Synaphobranchus kaupii]